MVTQQLLCSHGGSWQFFTKNCTIFSPQFVLEMWGETALHCQVVLRAVSPEHHVEEDLQKWVYVRVTDVTAHSFRNPELRLVCSLQIKCYILKYFFKYGKKGGGCKNWSNLIPNIQWWWAADGYKRVWNTNSLSWSFPKYCPSSQELVSENVS